MLYKIVDFDKNSTTVLLNRQFSLTLSYLEDRNISGLSSAAKCHDVDHLKHLQEKR